MLIKIFKEILKHNLILHVKFENFINAFDKENQKITRFLGLPKKINFHTGADKIFDYNISKKNIYKSKKNLTKFEFNMIKKKLKTYLQW